MNVVTNGLKHELMKRATLRQRSICESMGVKIQLTQEKLLEVAYTVGIRHGIDLAQGRIDKLLADKSETMQKEISGGKAEFVCAAVWNAEYVPFTLGLNHKSPDLKLPDGRKAEVKSRPQRMLMFIDRFPHETADLIILCTDGYNWSGNEVEIIGTITRERAMKLYNENPQAHTKDFGRGLGPQPVWYENELDQLPPFTPFDVNRLFLVGFKVLKGN